MKKEEKSYLQKIKVVQLDGLMLVVSFFPKPPIFIVYITLSLYFIILRLILEVSTQVTKSSIVRVTRYAGSLMVVGPTRTWPCSMKVVASLTVSAILSRHMTIGNRLRQNADTVTLLQSLNLLVDVMMPIA